MLLFYIDESGHHRMAPDDEHPDRLARDTSDSFVLSAVGIRDTERRPIAEAIDALKSELLGSRPGRAWGDTERRGRRPAFTPRPAAGAPAAPHRGHPAA